METGVKLAPGCVSDIDYRQYKNNEAQTVGGQRRVDAEKIRGAARS
jgi:hypothetical protein